ncbi:MAG TPA: winged helix-turn-helix domain-containing protein [Bryobacteraceae bacterium]|nr:winged helix-turn-helix domain-containing protein [Bryobacteraceae bacterium]
MSFPAPKSVSVRPKLRFGPFEVDLENRELRKHGIRIKLQRKPFQILEFLLQRPGQLVMRNDLAQLLWPGMHVSFDRSLNTAVNALRRALGDTSRNARFIETRTGLGYLFMAPVEEVGVAASARAEAGIQLVRSNAANAEAPQDCLKGRYFCHKLTEEDLHKGVAHFNAALAQNPECPFSYAGLADAYCLSALLNMVTPAEIYPRAKQMALSALRVRQDLGDGHAALATVKRLFEWDWAGAEAEYLTALVLSSNSAMTHQAYGAHLAATGKAEEALRELRRSEEIDPLSPVVNVGVAWGLYVARDFQGASEQSWKVLAMEPKFGAAQYTLGLAYAQMGLAEDAVVELRNARICAGDQPAVLAALAHVHASAGESSEAAGILGELESLSQRRFVSPYWLGLVYAGLGDRARALELLDRAYAERDVWLTWLGVEPRFDVLRTEPRFQELLRGVGLG